MPKLMSQISVHDALVIADTLKRKVKFKTSLNYEFFVEPLGNSAYRVSRWGKNERAVTMYGEEIVLLGDQRLHIGYREAVKRNEEVEIPT